MIITSRITFVLEQQGLAGWQLNDLKQLAGHFRSVFVLYNITRGKQAKLSESLKVLSLGSCRFDVCQIAIEGLDAELACMVMTEYLRDHSTLVSTSHKKNHYAQELFLQHNAFKLPFDYRWYYQADSHDQDKQQALQSVAKLATPEHHQALLQQLQKREQTSSTAIPGNIALPHVISQHVDVPTFIIQSLNKPIDWHSNHGDIVFLIAIILPEPLEKDWIVAVTRLTRWLIKDSESHLLLNAEREETIQAILLHIMAHAESL